MHHHTNNNNQRTKTTPGNIKQQPQQTSHNLTNILIPQHTTAYIPNIATLPTTIVSHTIQPGHDAPTDPAQQPIITEEITTIVYTQILLFADPPRRCTIHCAFFLSVCIIYHCMIILPNPTPHSTPSYHSLCSPRTTILQQSLPFRIGPTLSLPY